MAEKLEIIITAKDEFTKVFKGVHASLTPIAVGLAGMATATAGFAAAGLALARSVAAGQDQLSKYSDKLGVSVEMLSRLRYAADLADVGIEGLAMSLQFMLRFSADAAAGTEANVKTLQRLGISLEDIRRQSPDQMFQSYAEAIQKIQNPAERVQIAMEVFGRSGAEALKMLKKGFAETMAEAELFGVTTTQTAYNAAEFNDSLTRISKAVSGVKSAIVKDFIPVLTGAFNELAFWIADNRLKIVAWAKGFVATLATSAQAFIGFAAQVVDGYHRINAAISKYSYESNKKAITDLAKVYEEVSAKIVRAKEEIERAEGLKGPGQKAARQDYLSKQITGYEQQLVSIRARIVELGAEGQGFLQEWGDGLERALNKNKVNEYFDNLQNKIDEWQAKGTAELPEAVAPPALGGASAAGGGKAMKDQLASDLDDLQSMWERYRLTELDRINVWYDEQKMKFAGHKDALLKVEEIYQARLSDVRNVTDAERIDAEETYRKGLEETLLKIAGKNDEHRISETDKVNVWYQEQLEQYAAFEESRALLDLLYQERKREAQEADAEYEQAMYDKRLEAYAGLMGGLAALASSFGKKAFLLAKALNIGQALMSTYVGVANAMRDVPYPLNFVVAAKVLAFGMAQVAQIAKQKPPEAHSGLDYVPREQTYLLSKGERVIQPDANRDLTEFLRGGGAAGGHVTIERLEVFPNVTDARALRSMDAREMQEIVEEKIIPAMRRLKFAGIMA